MRPKDEFDMADEQYEERKLKPIEEKEFLTNMCIENCGRATFNTDKICNECKGIDETKLVCSNCGVVFDITKHDDSGYLYNKPYCAACCLELLDWL